MYKVIKKDVINKCLQHVYDKRRINIPYEKRMYISLLLILSCY